MQHSFAPIWSSIVDSSLWLEDDWVIKIFITMVVKKDYDHIYRFNTFNLAQQSKKTEQQVLDALKILSSPDRHRVEDTVNEGRRIKAHEEGWEIVNGDKYQKMMQREAKRARDRKSQQKWRDNQKNRQGPITGESTAMRAEARGDTETHDQLAATPKDTPRRQTPDVPEGLN